MFIEEIIGSFTGQNRRTRRRQVALGTILGLVTGSVTALLLAPQSGTETRKDIAKLAECGVTKGKELIAQGTDKAKEVIEDLSSRFSSGVEVVVTEDPDKAERKASRKDRIDARDSEASEK